MRNGFKKLIKAMLPGIRKSEALKRFLKVTEEKCKRPTLCKETLVLKSISHEHPYITYVFRALGKDYSSFVYMPDVDEQELESVDPAELNSIFLSVGISLAPFHWLLCDFKSLRVAGFGMSEKERQFYENFLEKGLAEFRYRNGLNPVRKIEIVAQPVTPVESATKERSKPRQIQHRALVLNGGGKDSAVMLELMKKRGGHVGALSINPKSFQDDVVALSGVRSEHSYKINYRVDKAIAQDAEYGWGHMPYSALFISLSQILAVAKNYTEVAFGNEQSSNEPNLFYKGVGLNHQFSKSYEFEQGFNRIANGYLSNTVAFYSPLRALTDISIAYIFSDTVEYKQSIVSCNVGGGQWCGKCPKCAFTFLSIAAFASNEDIVGIFGTNFLMSQEARIELMNLLNKRNKPWECVGTYDETRLIALRYFKRNPGLEFDVWPKRSHILRRCDTQTAEGLESQWLFKLHKPHNIPADLYAIIETELFKLEAMELTYGRCG